MLSTLWIGSAVFMMALHLIFAAGVGYLLILAYAAWRAPKFSQIFPGEPAHRFAILIPAHNEESLLPSCLESLSHLDYPTDKVSIHVVADNCTDQTALVARQRGATVHIRDNTVLRGKGYALQWLYQGLLQAKEPHDAVVILDADSIVSPNFLRVMAAHLEQGERAIQAYYTVHTPERSWNGSLRYAALAVLHYLRPQGRMVLGGSAGLKGNGMVFSAEILRKHSWSASVTEDIEFHMSLLLEGERVTFAPDALVWGEMPDTLAKSRSQHARWEQGRLEMARKYVPALVKAAWNNARRGKYQDAFILIDAVIEHLIPPFSLLLGICAMLWAIDLILLIIPGGRLLNLSLNQAEALGRLTWTNLIFSTGLLIGQVVYLFTGLALVKAPRSIYQSLLFAPIFIVWKIGHYLRVLLGQEQQGWVRTTRNET